MIFSSRDVVASKFKLRLEANIIETNFFVIVKVTCVVLNKSTAIDKHLCAPSSLVEAPVDPEEVLKSERSRVVLGIKQPTSQLI